MGIEIFILLGFVGAIGYSASTWGLKYHALGDLAVLLFCVQFSPLVILL
jgi:1,4-dihydroxy-2-naphthoate octaprenyltransferase